GNSIRKGHIMAYAHGPILVDPSAEEGENPALATRGRILGGGVARKSRGLGLLLDHEHQSIRLSQLIGKAINRRFHTYVDGTRKGVAEPKTDEFIELHLHPRYQDNVNRYMRVVGSIPVRQSLLQQQERLALLESQLLDPVTASSAALRLEAIGDDEAVAILEQGAASSDPEVRFYAAEALAYLDSTAAVTPLARAAIEEPAFRINALAALSTMEDGAASEALYAMLKAKSAETRYGAFRSLWTMNADDPRIRGERLGGKFGYHVLDVDGPPMIHVTSSHRSELVLFGKDHRLKLPLVLDAGKRIMVNGLSGGEITVSRFAPGEETQQRVVSTNVDAVVRAVVELGGQYPDVVQMLQEANEAGALSSRFRVNALPEPGREVAREGEAESRLDL
ncbi:MAG: HEAT repeat domain-containing protein, partial [Planctomycetota bacterium]